MFMELERKTKKERETSKIIVNWTVWRLVLTKEMKKVMENKSASEEEKETILKNFNMMLEEQNELIILDMVKTNFYTNA